MAGDMVQRAVGLEERLKADSSLAQQAVAKAAALRDSLRQAAEVRSLHQNHTVDLVVDGQLHVSGGPV